MKKIYFLLSATFICLGAQAQLTLTQAANAPLTGIYEIDTYFDSTTAIPKATGTNKSWNFTSFVTSTASAYSFTYVNASTTPSASAFPGSTLSTSDGSTSHDYYTSTTTSIDVTGSADVGDVTHFTNPITWMVWPFTFGTTNNDTFSGSETYSTTTMTISGNADISGTGTGTVTMPGGHAYTNCLQITRTYTYYLGAPLNYTVTTIAYEYWNSSFRGPIIGIEYDFTNDGSSISKDYQITVNSLADVGIEEHKSNDQTFAVYPNPVKDKITVVLKDNAMAESLELFDVSGKLINTEKNTNTLNTSNLNKGVYVLKVKSNGSYSQKQVIISE